LSDGSVSCNRPGGKVSEYDVKVQMKASNIISGNLRSLQCERSTDRSCILQKCVRRWAQIAAHRPDGVEPCRQCPCVHKPEVSRLFPDSASLFQILRLGQDLTSPMAGTPTAAVTSAFVNTENPSLYCWLTAPTRAFRTRKKCATGSTCDEVSARGRADLVDVLLQQLREPRGP